MKVIQIIPSFVLAGAEIMCENLTYELLERGCKVLVVSMYNYHSPITERMEASGVGIRYLGKKRGLDLSMIIKMRKLFMEEKPDVIHTHLYVMQYAIPAAVLAGVPVKVHTIHSVAHKEVGKLQRELAQLFFRFCGVVPVAISPRVKETIVSEYCLQSDRIPMIFNGVNLCKCIKKDSWRVQESFRFIHVGRLHSLKNQPLIMRAIRVLNDEGLNASVVFLGAGEMEAEYRALCCELGLEDSVCFLGSQDNVFPFLHDADAFLLPSAYEGMPISLIEAMGTGLPVIVSNVGGIPDMITDEENGLIIEPTLDDLVYAMKRIIVEENLRKKLGENNLKRVNTFSAVKMCEAYMSIYKG